MSIVETDLPGVFLIEPELVADRRGFFARLYDEEELVGLGIDAESRSTPSRSTTPRPRSGACIINKRLTARQK